MKDALPLPPRKQGTSQVLVHRHMHLEKQTGRTGVLYMYAVHGLHLSHSDVVDVYKSMGPNDMNLSWAMSLQDHWLSSLRSSCP